MFEYRCMFGSGLARCVCPELSFGRPSASILAGRINNCDYIRLTTLMMKEHQDMVESELDTLKEILNGLVGSLTAKSKFSSGPSRSFSTDCWSGACWVNWKTRGSGSKEGSGASFLWNHSFPKNRTYILIEVALLDGRCTFSGIKKLRFSWPMGLMMASRIIRVVKASPTALW